MKVLIYKDKNSLEPIGGPTGYLYNLYNELNKNENTEIEFLDSKKSKIRMVIKKIYEKLPNEFRKKYKYKKNIKEIYNILNNVISDKKNKISKIDLNKYDAVHFHDTYTMYMVKDSLENYKGKVIITSHSPKVYFKEILDKVPNDMYLQRKKDFDKLEKIDTYAFNRADYILFPCEEAEEPYFNTWEKYKDIKQKNLNKYIYIPTGIIPKNIVESQESIRSKYNIPPDAMVISYVGRHIEVKGYKKLKEIGERILEKNENVYFLIAGVEAPIKGLKHERWIEVGWNKNPMNLVNASDVFILPNKETYFDLILLEVMSIGKSVILTNTGGNKYFKKFENAGLYYYEYSDVDEVEKIVNNLSKEKLNRDGENNKNIIFNNFTVGIFLKKYINVLNNLINEKED